jgi:hypothetical protein
MDPDAWNAYHIISNRARSVCYATRNLQFRLKTEFLVNQLALTAGDQMDFLEKLKVVCYYFSMVNYSFDEDIRLRCRNVWL